MTQEELFEMSGLVVNPERVCKVCGRTLKPDQRGILRHKAGDGKRCDEILRANLRQKKPA